jgi:hypothetical protein
VRPTDLIDQRMRAAGIQRRQVAELLGVHFHRLELCLADLGQLPLTLVVDLARLLDLSLADLLPQICDQQAPACAQVSDEAHRDAMPVLAALAHARCPLAVNDLAASLMWAPTRVQAALDHIHDHPDLAGPYAMHRVPIDRFTLHPRLDLLTSTQTQTVSTSRDTLYGLTPQEATMLLLAIGAQEYPGRGIKEFGDYITDHATTARDLIRRGLLQETDTHRAIEVTPDVANSLHLADSVHAPHLPLPAWDELEHALAPLPAVQPSPRIPAERASDPQRDLQRDIQGDGRDLSPYDWPPADPSP